MKVHPLYITCPTCGVQRNDYCRDLVTHAPTITFHSARVAGANE